MSEKQTLSGSIVSAFLGSATLTHVLVQHASSRCQQTVWRVSENILGDIATHGFTDGLRLSQGISKVE